MGFGKTRTCCMTNRKWTRSYNLSKKLTNTKEEGNKISYTTNKINKRRLKVQLLRKKTIANTCDGKKK